MKAVIVYDRVDLAVRINSILSWQAISQRQQLEIKLLRIDMLMHPSKANRAMEQAFGAHALILATRIQPRLAPELLEWLETWAAARSVPDAVVGVFDGQTENRLSTQLTSDLRCLAQRHRLTFICGNLTPDTDKLCTAEYEPRNPEEISQNLCIRTAQSLHHLHTWGIRGSQPEQQQL